MRRFTYISILLLIFAFDAMAQNVNSVKKFTLDSAMIRENRLNKINEVTVGTRVSNVNSVILKGSQTKSLSELLSDNTMVYIKSLGQGALATSSFRGTSSGHTQVNWNGININPVMSGSFDFSQIPVFFADNVTLFHGSGHLKNGTGALGGSININNRADWKDSTRFNAFAEIGSYDTYTTAASIKFLNKKSLFRTRLYYQQSENNYRYLNKVFKKEAFYEYRKEAKYKFAGIMQEGYFKLSDNSNIYTNLWVQSGSRRLPQPIIVNITQHEKQEDSGLKYLIGYNFRSNKHDFSVKGAYLLNILDYDKWFDNDYFPNESSHNLSQTVHIICDYLYDYSSKLNLNAALKYTHDFVNATNFSKTTVNRNVISLQTGVLWNLFSHIIINGHMMLEVNDNRYTPTFSAGISSPIIKGILSAKANWSYNYKFPSMNDLYWQPGGNSALLPEKGFSYDATLTFIQKSKEHIYFKSEITGYLMNINNWIMWLPTMNWYWEPRNVKNVLSYGLEVLTECNIVFNSYKVKLGVNYTYSPSINRDKNFEEDDTYHKQLPYVPLHKANARLAVDYGKLSFSYQICYTGKRYTSEDESYSTVAYTIHDAELKYDMFTKKHFKLTPKLRVNNLFNAFYESTQYYPMPLRNISGSIMITF
ncbi:MAG: TonB-dependent receptor plug domain-containing protein [Bacteroidales bacterium]|nr:TonB-dependent receptor plug domain-containing protein [Bacteroidales bacterium]